MPSAISAISVMVPNPESDPVLDLCTKLLSFDGFLGQAIKFFIAYIPVAAVM